MAVLKHSARPGMLALLEAAGVTKREITPSHLGFVLGPRINASGRLANASMAMELLSTQDVARARELAQSIEALNRERMQLQNDIWDLVKARVSERIERGMFQHAIVVGDPSWHEGVVGIVASRVVETFGKPAVVIGNGKGSVRSTRGIDVLQALRDSSAWLKGFGGHRFAAGLSLEMENLEAFSNAFDASVGALLQAGGGRSRETLWIDALAMPGDLDWATYAELGELGPWGPSYPEPVIAVESRALSFRAMKDRHLKINLEGGLEAVWFHTPEPPQILGKRWTESKQPLWWVGVPEVNQFMGRSTRVLRLKDVGTTMSPELLSSFQLSPSEYRPIEAARV